MSKENLKYLCSPYLISVEFAAGNVLVEFRWFMPHLPLKSNLRSNDTRSIDSSFEKTFVKNLNDKLYLS